MRSSWVLALLTASLVLIGIYLVWVGVKRVDPPSTLPVIETSSPTPEATSSTIEGVSGETALVTKVVDGDTIEVLMGGKVEKVRLIGIDTPETKDPRRPVGCFGKEASSETKSLLEGKKVSLERDVSETDKYSRLLRYIYVQMGSGETLFVNDYLIRAGFALALTYPPDVKYTERFLEAQSEAKAEERGLWKSCK